MQRRQCLAAPAGVANASARPAQPQQPQQPPTCLSSSALSLCSSRPRASITNRSALSWPYLAYALKRAATSCGRGQAGGSGRKVGWVLAVASVGSCKRASKAATRIAQAQRRAGNLLAQQRSAAAARACAGICWLPRQVPSPDLHVAVHRREEVVAVGDAVGDVVEQRLLVRVVLGKGRHQLDQAARLEVHEAALRAQGGGVAAEWSAGPRTAGSVLAGTWQCAEGTRGVAHAAANALPACTPDLHVRAETSNSLPADKAAPSSKLQRHASQSSAP